jgi:hypothetical protein
VKLLRDHRAAVAVGFIATTGHNAPNYIMLPADQAARTLPSSLYLMPQGQNGDRGLARRQTSIGDQPEARHCYRLRTIAASSRTFSGPRYTK